MWFCHYRIIPTHEETGKRAMQYSESREYSASNNMVSFSEQTAKEKNNQKSMQRVPINVS